MKPAVPLDAMGEVAQRVRRLSAELWGEQEAIEVVGRHQSVLDLHRKAEKIAAFQEPVLITGESGVGKESLAQAIYLLSPRRGKAFVSVNCPQYREGNLTVSELFGHRRGSFTGAIADRKGCFETADGGVIFLDEIGDLHMSAQVMLLRALAKGEFQPLGSEQTRKVSVRVIAATNRPLDRLTLAEEFRHDLLFRLQYFLLHIPPLRERGDDWFLLLGYYLTQLYLKYGVRKNFSKASLRLLEQYAWPGNIRELVSATTTGYAMADGDTIEPEDFVGMLNTGRAHQSAAPVEDELYERIVVGRESFWDVVHSPFLARDLNRAQVRAVVRRGLREVRGSYRLLVDHFGIPPSGYQKFMDFLRHHLLKPSDETGLRRVRPSGISDAAS
ncbi:MAG TPA: sigma 54-interacting transcriptional regulator [Thermoanaerobaculia bacterium]